MFKVIRSSAGAGKTHALVKHYLGLCLRTADPTAYRQVLALTFTNKAAEEMRERVLSYLRKLAANEVSEPALADVMQELMKAPGATEEESVKRADAVLRHMLHHYSDVAISTIDAFTRRVARPFARDLRLDQALRMTTDQDWYRDRAVEALIAEAGTSDEVTRLLMEACEQLLEDEQRWDPAASLRDLIKELDREGSIEPLLALQTLDFRTAQSLRRKLREEAAAASRRIRDAGEECLQRMADAGAPVEAWTGGSKGVASWFRKLASHGSAWIPESKTLTRCLETGKWHGPKASASDEERILGAVPALAAAARHAIDALEREQRGFALRNAVRKLLPTAIALRELSRCLDQEKNADGVAFFSDLTRRVAEVMRDEPAPWILERVGERYRHFLIDEFQDTSMLQWQCLLPLIDNALGSGGSALVVGDAKQAIYRWRNGEAQLLIRFPRLHGRSDSELDKQREDAIVRHHQEGEPLNSNRRSGRTIIEFNNALFEAVGAALPPAWSEAYAALRQQSAKQEEGLVRLRVLDEALKGEAAQDAEESFMLQAVEECLADGFQPGDIALLVRDGKKGQRMVERLMTAGHAVSSPDGARLSSSPTILLIVELLRFIQTGDAATAARVVQRLARHAALADAEQIDPYAGMGRDDPQRAARAWLREHGPLTLRTTLTALIRDVASALGLDPALDAHLLLLIDEAHAFGVEHGPDLLGFLDHWERRGSMRSLQGSKSTASIQVMTIHKAKGLQFPAVIVPNTRMAPSGNHGDHLWVDAREVAPELGMALVKESSALASAGLPEVVMEQEARLFDEANLLYVAFTRPEQRLYALAQRAGADTVTRALISHLDGQLTNDEAFLGRRQPPWALRAEKDGAYLEASSSATARALPLRFEAPGAWDVADPDPQRRRGNLLHDALSRTADAAALPEAIDSMQREGLIVSNEAEALRTELAELLASEDVAMWFRPGLRARTEATIIGGDGHAYRPDRVVIDGQAARVLDIKTGAPAPGHHDQVRGYARLLRELGFAQVEAALLYTQQGRIEPVEA